MAACAHFTRAGTHSAVNQDTCTSGTCSTSCGSVSYAAVFDGHSAFGEVAATTACDALNTIMGTELSWEEEPEASMRKVIEGLNSAVLAAHRPDSLPAKHKHSSGGETFTFKLNQDKTGFAVSGGSASGQGRVVPVDFGCTAAVAVLTPHRRLVVGNLGDSVVLLCSAGNDDDVAIKRVSESHTASTASEIERIEAACGGSVKLVDGYLQGLKGPVQGLALQPTRGLGHPVWARFGVSAEPFITSLSTKSLEWDADKEGFGVVVLSDGVSDVLSEESILDTVAQSEGAEETVRELVEEAAGLADVSSDGRDRDDASAAVIFW